MSMLIKILLTGNTAYSIWGIVLKISLLLAGIGIVLIWKSRPRRLVYVLLTGVLISLSAVSAVAASRDITTGNYATGFYSGFDQLYTENDFIWGVACESAKTKGSFNHVIPAGQALDRLTVVSASESGTLILHVKQNGSVKSWDISGLQTEISIDDLTWLDPEEQIQLSVEHTTAENIRFTISW